MGKGDLTMTLLEPVVGEEARFQTIRLTTTNTKEEAEVTKPITRVVRTATTTEEIEDKIQEKLITKK